MVLHRSSLMLSEVEAAIDESRRQHPRFSLLIEPEHPAVLGPPAQPDRSTDRRRLRSVRLDDDVAHLAYGNPEPQVIAQVDGLGQRAVERAIRGSIAEHDLLGS